MAIYAGKKPNWAREIDSNNFQDIFGLTAAAAQKLNVVRGESVLDQDGNKRVLVHATSLAATLTLTDYANFQIGSTITHITGGAAIVYIKVASTASPVIGDWDKLTGATVT